MQIPPPPLGFTEVVNPMQAGPPQGPVTVGTPRPRQPPPQTAADAQGDDLRNVRTRQEIAAHPVQVQRTQQQITQGDTRGVNFSDENALRNNFNALPAVRDYNAVIPLYVSAEEAGDNTAGDLQLVYAFSKIQDPQTGVRDAEAENVRNAGTIADRVRALQAEIDASGRLQPQTRENLRAELRTRRQALARAYTQQRVHYAQIARDSGFDPDRIIGPHAALPYAQQEQPGQPPAPQSGDMRERDIGFSGRAEDRPDVAELTPAQVAAYNAYMGQFQRGQLTAEALGAQWQRITGRPLNNAAAIADDFNRTGRFTRAEGTVYANPTAEQLFAERNERDGRGGSEDLLFHGATLGMTDEAGGVGSAIVNAIRSPFTDEDFDPVGSYNAGNQAQDMRIDDARNRSGLLGTAAEVLGGFGSGIARPGATPTGLVGRMGQGASYGAEVGALAGFGYGEGLQGSVVNTLAGAAGGATIGAGIPIVGAGLRGGANLVRTATGRNPGLARQRVAEAIADDGNTPRGVGQQMSEAQQNGVPMMLADTGDNARGLLAASARAPGAGRTLARDALDERQAGLGERVTGAVERDLGPISNPHEVHDQLVQQAQAAARPLYEQAYSAPGADTFARRIGSLLSRPAMQRAMQRARAIAQEEGRDPNTLGFDVNSSGEVTAIRTPSWQTFDYVKRGIDDVLQAQPRDPRTGSLILDEGTRAIEGTRRAFLSQIDRANPAYAQARAAWAGPARARDAMDLGRRSMNMNADDLTARTRDMGPNEREFLLLGIRRAMAERVSALGDTANVTHALLGTGKRRALMLRLFGGRQSFDRFVSTLQQEQAGFQTYRAARLGSPTAPNMQDDAALNAATMVADIGTTGLPVTTIVRNAIQFGTGRAGREAQQQIAALLSERDPARLSELARELNRQAARGRAHRRRASAGTATAGRAAGHAAGALGAEFTGRD